MRGSGRCRRCIEAVRDEFWGRPQGLPADDGETRHLTKPHRLDLSYNRVIGIVTLQDVGTASVGG